MFYMYLVIYGLDFPLPCVFVVGKLLGETLSKMKYVLGGGEWMVSSLWGMRCVDDLDFSHYLLYPY